MVPSFIFCPLRYIRRSLILISLFAFNILTNAVYSYTVLADSSGTVILDVKYSFIHNDEEVGEIKVKILELPTTGLYLVVDEIYTNLSFLIFSKETFTYEEELIEDCKNGVYKVKELYTKVLSKNKITILSGEEKDGKLLLTRKSDNKTEQRKINLLSSEYYYTPFGLRFFLLHSGYKEKKTYTVYMLDKGKLSWEKIKIECLGKDAGTGVYILKVYLPFPQGVITFYVNDDSEVVLAEWFGIKILPSSKLK
jgi:hypothetical protein